MKKRLKTLFSFILSICFLLPAVGCGEDPNLGNLPDEPPIGGDPTPDPEPDPDPEPEPEPEPEPIAVERVERTGGEGNVDVFTVTMNDETHFTITVTGGSDTATEKRIDYENATANNLSVVYPLTEGAQPCDDVLIVPIETETEVDVPIGCLKVETGRIGQIDVQSDVAGFDGSLIEWSSDGVLVSGGSVFSQQTGATALVGEYGKYRFVCYVEALPCASPTLSISQQRVIMDAGDTAGLSVLEGGEAYDYVAWSVADNAVATVDENGTVCAVGSGKTVVSARSHGTVLQCEVVVSGVDACLDEWFQGDAAIYRGVDLRDPLNGERGFVTYARMTENGLYYGGYAYHSVWETAGDLWHQNTNFEVFVRTKNDPTGEDTAIQYYASNGFCCPGATSAIKTVQNPNATSEYDKYYTVFELHVDVGYYDADNTYVRSGFAFKTPGDKMNIIRGGATDSPFYDMTDWWWTDLHYPSNFNEMYYITATGIYEEVTV